MGGAGRRRIPRLRQKSGAVDRHDQFRAGAGRLADAEHLKKDGRGKNALERGHSAGRPGLHRRDGIFI